MDKAPAKVETKPVEVTNNSLLDEYFKPTIPYTDTNVLYFEPSVKSYRQVLANVSKDKVELVYEYDVNGDNIFDSRIDKVSYTLPEEIRDFAMASTYTDSTHQWYTLLAESFSFQKDNVTLVALTDTKVSVFYQNPKTQSLSSKILPGGRKKFTNIYIKGPDQTLFYDYYEYEGDSYGGYQGGTHFIPICYNVDTKDLFVQFVAGGNQSIKYLKSYLNKDGEIVTNEIPYTGITCLDRIATVKDIRDGII